MKNQQHYLLLSLILSLPFICFSTILHVPSNYSSIQQGINTSINGDTVLVSPGVYYENLNLNGKNTLLCSAFIFSGNIATIDSTVIDGNNNFSVITIDQNEDSTCKVIGFTIRNGNALETVNAYGNGGGILVSYASPQISHCIIINNTANHEGGGIYLHGYESSSGSNNHTKISNCIISNNTAYGGGGGAKIANCSADCEIFNCIITNNFGTYGGGVQIYHRGKIVNCLIAGNTASGNNDAGGVHIDWGTFFGSQGAYIIGCTIVNNTGYYRGGTNNTIIGGEFQNCILWGNTNQSGEISNYNGSTFQYSCTTPLPTGSGNISFDPDFSNASMEDYTLSFESHCVDAGSNSFNTLEIDLNGNQRVMNDIIDMGCYEFSIGLILDFSSDITTSCINQTISYSPDTLNTMIDSLLWTFPGGSPISSVLMFPEITYNTEGVFDVTLTSWKNGVSHEINKSEYIEVFPIPTIPNIPTGAETVCFSAMQSEYYTNTEQAIWELFPAEAGTINFYDSTCKIIWSETFKGEAYLKVKNYNGCGEGDFSEALTIQKLEAIVPGFTATPTQFVGPPYDVAFSNLTANPELYDFVWYFGNGDSSLMAQPEYTYPEGGTYTVSLVASEKATGCNGSFILENYIFCSGLGIGDNEETGFKYYVDWNKNSLELFFDQQPDNLNFSLFDLLGFEHRTNSLSQKSTSIPLNGLIDGMYVFVIDGKITGKMILLR